MKKTVLCQGCWEQMHIPVPIRGPLSFPFRIFGIKQTKMHPNLCTICELMFTRIMKNRQISIPTTIMFADLRGYTSLSEKMEANELNEILNCFYDNCSQTVWDEEGIINKFIGDAVLAIFNFPMVRENHIEKAVEAGLKLQEKCKTLKEKVCLKDNIDLGVGIGIHSGIASIGEIGTSYKEFTAIGPVVNLASRIQGQAKSGEIVITESVYDEIKEKFPDLEKRVMNLKGIDEPVNGYVLSSRNY